MMSDLVRWRSLKEVPCLLALVYYVISPNRIKPAQPGKLEHRVEI